jgi:hypothetical protein
MNHNYLARFRVRLETSPSSKFLSDLPLVWSGGIRQLKEWVAERNLQFCACQQEILGGHYHDPKTGYNYYLEMK